jgi:hypothetical protein
VAKEKERDNGDKDEKPARILAVSLVDGNKSVLKRIFESLKFWNKDNRPRRDVEEGYEVGAGGPSTEREPMRSSPEYREAEAEGFGRRVARMLLQPVGLWVYTRDFVDDRSLPNGIPRMTAFIASDPDGLTSIYRRFDKLNIRNLLLLEAKLAALETLQDQLDKEDAENLQTDMGFNFAMATTHGSFEYFALLGEGREFDRESRIRLSSREGKDTKSR